MSDYLAKDPNGIFKLEIKYCENCGYINHSKRVKQTLEKRFLNLKVIETPLYLESHYGYLLMFLSALKYVILGVVWQAEGLF